MAKLGVSTQDMETIVVFLHQIVMGVNYTFRKSVAKGKSATKRKNTFRKSVVKGKSATKGKTLLGKVW
jgi:hypothetical protein